MQNIILESNYFPCISYFKEMANATLCEIDQQDSFKKMSFRNRCVVIGANGLINLTVPVEGGRNTKQLMKDVRISYSESWQQQHWKTILSSYAKAPFFEYYQYELEQLIKKRNDFLLDKNLEITLWLSKRFKLQTTITQSISNLESVVDGKINFINKWLPNNYNKVESAQVEYNQMFQEKLGFQKNVSVLDLILCEGPSKDVFAAV